MRFLVVLLPLLVVAGSGAAMAAQNEADDIIIVSVKPRNPDVKPEIATLQARSEHKTSALENHSGTKIAKNESSKD